MQYWHFELAKPRNCGNYYVNSYLTTNDVYNRDEVTSYANKYALSGNSNYHTYENDCTNFMSQCVFAGGLYMLNKPNNVIDALTYDTKISNWYYDMTYHLINKECSLTWSSATYSRNHFGKQYSDNIGRAYKFLTYTPMEAYNNFESIRQMLSPGDIIYQNDEVDISIGSHSLIVTDVTHDDIITAQHSPGANYKGQSFKATVGSYRNTTQWWAFAIIKKDEEPLW